ncbi:hypothetical protein [Bradyrhizobium sp. JYMT SZCCT0180]|uniref:hypothetical protein n=1 Tax=Bradyrhizobium sp. JYMT SZCCT0180 TaxID=2807666 RepID=UPI001BAC8376|nr:hypothetical protein [Bradyrhizobium sp. JYMT SZCCT0180]MBR1215850.1 hypothetical protein [Bradyrhizobium sp. JYMT SZCCT0180]
MAEAVVRIIGALIEAVFELMAERIGRRVLSFWGYKSNSFIELLVGLAVASAIGILVIALISALLR